MRTLDILLRQNLNNNVRVKHCYLTIIMNGKEFRIGLENFDAPYGDFFIEDGPWHAVALNGKMYDIQVYCYDNEMQVQLCDIDSYEYNSTTEGDIKLLAILPLAYGIASFIATTVDDCGCYGEVLWFPYFLRTQYGWFGIALIIGFYLAHLLVRLFFKFQSNTSGIDADTYKGTHTEQIAINIVSALILAVLTLLYFLVNSIMEQYIYVRIIYHVQLISIISGAFILLYSGARGYNKKWFQYGSYLYYPLHLAIIAAIAAIVFSI